jgi:hypothetical protein
VPPKYKHADTYLRGLDDCPPNNARPTESIGFRFVFNPIDGQSFLIPAERDTERFEEDPTCPQCGLSMYTTLEEAKAAFKRLIDKIPQIGTLLGDHVAEVKLSREHGVQTEPNTLGHFALYEYEGADLVSVATLKGPL